MDKIYKMTITGKDVYNTPIDYIVCFY